MVALRCTRKLARLLKSNPTPNPEASTNALGDWYGNVVPTSGGELAVFVNERSLLTVAVPTNQGFDLIPFFYRRVANVLSMIGIDYGLIERELQEMQTLQIAKTANRRIFGAMNEVAYQLQLMVEHVPPGTTLSLSDAELELSDFRTGRCGTLRQPASPVNFSLRPVCGVTPNPSLQRTLPGRSPGQRR